MKTIAALCTMLFATCAVIPARISVQGQYGTYHYSSKGGLEVEINTTK